MRYDIGDKLPQNIIPPLEFREKDGEFEGEVMHPKELLLKFEPMDILNNATELVDAHGYVITIHSDDPMVI